MKIKLTDFALKHFDPKSTGTKILDVTPSEFEERMNCQDIQRIFQLTDSMNNTIEVVHSFFSEDDIVIRQGYAPFCKLLAIKNFTDAKVGSLPITLENYQYIRSGYSARKRDELPVLSRWLELPLGKPKAEWLMLVLYNKEQVDIEAKKDYEKQMKAYKEGISFVKPVNPVTFDSDWGVVAILGQSHNEEEPMQPITMIRNAYMHGGSGHPLDEEAYMKAVDFWEHNIIVR